MKENSERVVHRLVIAVSKMICRLLQPAQTILIAIALASLCKVAARHVHVDVKSSGWPRYSLSDIAETAEAVSEHSPPSFWLYVEELCRQSERIDSLSSDVSSGSSNSEAMAELQTIAMDAAQAVTPSSLHALMGTSLGVGSYTPAVRFFQGISESFGNPCNGGTRR